jgi:hypothetical protein
MDALLARENILDTREKSKTVRFRAGKSPTNLVQRREKLTPDKSRYRPFEVALYLSGFGVYQECRLLGVALYWKAPLARSLHRWTFTPFTMSHNSNGISPRAAAEAM